MPSPLASSEGVESFAWKRTTGVVWPWCGPRTDWHALMAAFHIGLQVTMLVPTVMTVVRLGHDTAWSVGMPDVFITCPGGPRRGNFGGYERVIDPTLNATWYAFQCDQVLNI